MTAEVSVLACMEDVQHILNDIMRDTHSGSLPVTYLVRNWKLSEYTIASGTVTSHRVGVRCIILLVMYCSTVSFHELLCYANDIEWEQYMKFGAYAGKLQEIQNRIM